MIVAVIVDDETTLPNRPEPLPEVMIQQMRPKASRNYDRRRNP